MSRLHDLGRRFERLLYFGIAITAACLFTALLSSAINERHRVEMRDALEAFATEIEKARPTLQDEYKLHSASKNLAYELHLRLLARYAAIDVDDKREAVIGLLTDTADANLTVDQNLAKVRAKANEAIEPVRMLGVEIPRNIKVSVVGQDLYVPVELLSRALTVLLGPLLMIWLGSLYATRIREIQLLRTCNDVTESFPHILNTYPLRFDVPWQRLKKFGIRSPRETRYGLTAVRVLIVLVMIGSALWGYGNALYYFVSPNIFESLEKYLVVVVVAGILVGEALVLVAAEIVGGWLQIGFDVSLEGLIETKTKAEESDVTNTSKPKK